MNTTKFFIATALCVSSVGFAQQFGGSTNQTGSIFRTGTLGIGVAAVPTGIDFMAHNAINKSAKIVFGNASMYGAFANTESVAQIYNLNSVNSSLNLVSAAAATSNVRLSLSANLTGTTTGISLAATSPANKKNFVFDMYGTNAMIITTTGQVGIGTGLAALGTTKLAVNGVIGAREIKVTLATTWPDYVFNKEYKRKNFEELASYLTTEKHLPYMTKAEVMEKEGTQSLGETQQNMLRSLEELYLYVLDLKKENTELRKEIELLKK